LASARLTSLTPGAILAPQQMLARTLPLGGSDPNTARREALSDTTFSNIRVTVAPENVTTVPMSFIKGPDAPPPSEKFIIAKRNDTLVGILEANGIAAAEARHAVATIASKIKDGIIRDGQKLKLLTQPNETKASPNALLRVIVYDEERALAALVRNDKGQFITIAPPVSAQPTPTQNARRNNTDDEGNGVSIYQSLYETGARNDIPRPVIEQLMKVFFFDIDLQKEVNEGDQIELFYNDDDERDARKEVLFAALTIDGATKRYYRFQNNSDGTIDHFDESGRSNRRFLIRKPITEGIFRSGFGLRYHPVLHYSKMHTGVDWADKIGTPIFAAGDGVVIKAEWDSGYGRRVEIQHNYNFVTTYNHLSAFAAGINEGVKVRQGQVIGYLGNSGLSTGPHLHYEVMVNDNYVDPLSIKLPSNKELDRAQMAEFKRERERIDDLLKQTVVTSSAR
jgi:murein DD-endopeptidase MepM/ murein hydrolase activator NlpD